MSTETIPWTNLAGTVSLLQDIMSGAMVALGEGNEDAAEFMEGAFTLTDERVEQFKTLGVDMTNERDLYVYVAGYSQAVLVAHSVLHMYEFDSPEIPGESTCYTFVQSTLANLVPLLPLLPLHLIVKEEPNADA